MADRILVYLSETEHPLEFLSVVLKLPRARAWYLLGQQLAQQFPTAEAMDGFLDSEELLEAAFELVQVLADVREEADEKETVTSEDVFRAMERHNSRAFEAVQRLAGLLHVSVQDLTSALIA